MTQKTWFITGASRGFGREWSDRRARARRPRRGHRPRHLDPRRPGREVRRRDPAAAARRHRPGGRRRRRPAGAPALRPPRRGRQQRRLRPLRLRRGAHGGGVPGPDGDQRLRGHVGHPGGAPADARAGVGPHPPGLSIGGITAFPIVGAYHASKWALEGFSQALAQEVAGFGIHVTLIEPGGFATDWGGASAKRSEPLPAYAAQHEQVAEQREEAGRQPRRPAGLRGRRPEDRRRRRAAPARVPRLGTAPHRPGRLRVAAGLVGAVAGRRRARPGLSLRRARSGGDVQGSSVVWAACARTDHIPEDRSSLMAISLDKVESTARRQPRQDRQDRALEKRIPVRHPRQGRAGHGLQRVDVAGVQLGPGAEPHRADPRPGHPARRRRRDRLLRLRLLGRLPGRVRSTTTRVR